tara:strand:- start:29 stop:808 length:780 start_codon:yes stop_codon:yes gene_type:complete
MTTDPKNNLREVAVRGVISHLVGPKYAPLADAAMTLIGSDSGEVYKKGKDFLGNVAKGYWEKMGERPARHTYERLTDKATPKQMAGSVQSGRPRPEDDFFNPGGDVLRKSTDFLKGTGWRRGFYENPEMTAEIVGATTAAAPLIAGGALLSSIAQGEKPRSEYSYPVEPDRGGYNPNVEASQASNYFQNQILDKKHAHALELLQLREQARIPGVQDTSMGSYGGGNLNSANPFGGVLANSFGNTRVFPDSPGITSIPLG